MKIALVLLLAAAPCLFAQFHAQEGDFTIHMIRHAIGSEHYTIEQADGGLLLKTTFEYSDRGNTRTTEASLQMKADYTPLELDVKGRPPIDLHAMPELPSHYFTILGPSPFAIQMALMRYWVGHHAPELVPVMRDKPGADPLKISHIGQTMIHADGKNVRLEQYRIGNLMFGGEIVWLDETATLAAAMTFAGGLPMEAVRNEFEPAFAELYSAGVTADIAPAMPPERGGSFAISGARLVDGTDVAPVDDSVVIVRDGRIVAAGPRSSVKIPRSLAVVDAKGKTLLPGLWEMHTHFSGSEFGPALLATGITTARDCGGEFEFLVRERDAIRQGKTTGPRLLLAGLVDAGGLKAFGHVTAETPDEGRAVVRRYHDAGFQQMKLYTFLQPDVIRAVADEAHRLGMTVTGHVPQVFNAYQGVEAGMDQINHLQYVTAIMRPQGAPRDQPVDLNSDTAQKALAFLAEHHTVVDPTAGWGEMSSHSHEVLADTFEPGVAKAPFILQIKFREMGSNTTAAQMQSRLANNLAVIGALHKAGVPIVAGSDTGLVGYGLLREIELYVKAGLTPMEAIQSATIVPARAMGLDKDTGTVEAGKRADLILVDGDPLANISDLRRVTAVVSDGKIYSTAALWRSVGFRP